MSASTELIKASSSSELESVERNEGDCRRANVGEMT